MPPAFGALHCKHGLAFANVVQRGRGAGDWLPSYAHRNAKLGTLDVKSLCRFPTFGYAKVDKVHFTVIPVGSNLVLA